MAGNEATAPGGFEFRGNVGCGPAHPEARLLQRRRPRRAPAPRVARLRKPALRWRSEKVVADDRKANGSYQRRQALHTPPENRHDHGKNKQDDGDGFPVHEVPPGFGERRAHVPSGPRRSPAGNTAPARAGNPFFGRAMTPPPSRVWPPAQNSSQVPAPATRRLGTADGAFRAERPSARGSPPGRGLVQRWTSASSGSW